MKKRRGNNFTLYLPEREMEQVKMISDDEDLSVSQIVSRAIKRYLNDPERGCLKGSMRQEEAA